MVKSSESELVFLPLGGSNEIGMNLNLYGWGPGDQKQWIMVDCGVTFGDSSTPGVDVIVPDPSFIVERKDQLLGMVITHGHEDHLGAVPYLWEQLRCPVYATPFAAFLLREKLREAGILDAVPLHEVPVDGDLSLGPFDIQLITLTHSIPEPNGLAITTPVGTVWHTGDWKLDPTPVGSPVSDIPALKSMGQDGVLAMVCDSTNVFVEGTSGSEEGVGEALKNVIKDLRSGKVAVTGFASNIGRVESIIRAAAAAERHVCLLGRSLGRYVAAAKSVGLLQDIPEFVTEDEARMMPDEAVLYLCTGSQGEPRAALARIAEGSHRAVSFGAGDTVLFSSRVIPGNEIGIRNLQNKLAANGVRIITEREHPIHVSGHPCRDELRDMYALAKPKIAIPTHGETRHLHEHARFALSLQVPHALAPENGQMIKITPKGASVIDEVPSGRLFVDGGFLVPADDDAMRLRRRMAYAGHITIGLAIDDQARVVSGPELRMSGMPADDDEPIESWIEDLAEEAAEAWRRLPKAQRRNLSEAETVLARKVRKRAEYIWDKRPLVECVILVV